MSALTLKAGDILYDSTIAAQSVAANPAISVWASANAGAGKTKVLIDRIARLLLAGCQPGRVMAVTYTQAAAAEMQTRLYDKLGSWTIASDAKLRQALLALDPELDLEKPGTLARARALFAQALETPGGLKIQTIHAFCQTILQRFPLEAGVPPGFQILDDSAKAALSELVFETTATKAQDAFLTLAAATYQDGHKEALRAATADQEALAVIEASAQPIGQRIAAALGINADDTPETLAQSALDRLDMDALREAAAALEHGGETDKATAQALRLALSDAVPTEAFAALVSLVRTQKDKIKEKQIYTKPMAKNAAVITALGPHDQWPSDFSELINATEEKIRASNLLARSCALTEAALIYKREWTQAKRSIGALDFDDVITATANLLSGKKGAAQWVLYKLDAGIEHILIDEAQDTSPQQWDLLAPLFDVLENELRDRPRTRFVVGDEKQSIYSFQGARPERFHQERARFEAGGDHHQDNRQALTFDLSFRTGQTILDAVDAVWSLSQASAPPPPASDEPRPSFERKYAFNTHHSAYRSGQIGAVELWPLMAKDKDKAKSDATPWDQSLDIEAENSPRNRLAEHIARELKHRLSQGATVWDGEKTRPMVPSDVMVLVKSRGAFFHQLIRRLKFHKVPVAGVDRIKLVEDPAIQDLIALGRFALLPEDDFNTACVLKGAFCGLTNDDQHIFPLAWDRGNLSLWQRLQTSPDPAHGRARAFLSRVLAGAAHRPPYEFFADLLELPLPFTHETGWQALIERLGREVREPVEAFLSRALDHGKTSAPTLQAFLSQLDLEAADVKREMDQSGSGVRVMTVHGAKGLEAPVVILPDTTSQGKGGDSEIQFNPEAAAFFWSPHSKEDIELIKAGRVRIAELEKQEAARLLYVAMTRARDILILCGYESGTAKEGFSKDSWFKSIEQGMGLLGPSQTMERADFAFQMWGRYPPVSDQSASSQNDAPLPLPAWLDEPPPFETPGPRRIAPSALAPDDALPPALSPLAQDARRRFLRGRLIHELLQRLPDVPRERWEQVAQARLARENDLDKSARAALVSETLTVLDSPRFARLFGPGSRAEAAIVGRGPGLPDDMVVNGTVDRLVVTESEVLVLDFKTNRPPPSRVEDVAQVYLNQMAAYRSLLQANWPGKVVRCALLWTDGPRLMELPEVILDKALRDIAALPR
jgi:ATP-dependent helicase/nuclease subunit A